ncbi:hypothetical protein EYF80_000382 [Liparis tanakae]|uniref:Uncharacterized protein n=1 Tax=Liparis tanakae TaxID=230148 RepID=A0A4Z2JH78_9TELE|nr:hypothetical protein EYF80_000382 [Liparis tanakae]
MERFKSNPIRRGFDTTELTSEVSQRTPGFASYQGGRSIRGAAESKQAAVGRSQPVGRRNSLRFSLKG